MERNGLSTSKYVHGSQQWGEKSHSSCSQVFWYKLYKNLFIIKFFYLFIFILHTNIKNFFLGVAPKGVNGKAGTVGITLAVKNLTKFHDLIKDEEGLKVNNNNNKKIFVLMFF